MLMQQLWRYCHVRCRHCTMSKLNASTPETGLFLERW